MSMRIIVTLALMALAACGGGPGNGQQEGDAAQQANDTALLEATQAPLERAREVQGTIDTRAAQMEADAAAAMQGLDPDDPDAAKEKEDEKQP